MEKLIELLKSEPYDGLQKCTSNIKEFVMNYLKSLVCAYQNEQHGMIIYGETEISIPDELHLDVRDFTPESNCNEMRKYLIIQKWNKEMMAYLYFSFLEPFFKTLVEIKKSKIIDWIKFSFDPLKAPLLNNNEMINVMRKPLAATLVKAIEDSGRVRNKRDEQCHKDLIVITNLVKTNKD
jgi:hypothetical protein